MSTFAELPPQLFLLGNVMRTGLILGGTSYLQDMLLPMNLSDAWLAPLLDKLESVKRQGWLVNDVYALQNLMESFLDFKPLTPAAAQDQDSDHDPERRVRFPDAARRCTTPCAAISQTARWSSFPAAITPSRWRNPALTADLLVRFATT